MEKIKFFNFYKQVKKEMKMGKKWNYLRDLLEKILMGVPNKISSEFKSLFPAENRHLNLNLAEKAAIYAYATAEIDCHSSNRMMIGELLVEVDNLSS